MARKTKIAAWIVATAASVAVFLLFSTGVLPYPYRPQAAATTSASSRGWRDDFRTFDSDRWVASSDPAPGSNAQNSGQFLAENVSLNGEYLVLKLRQIGAPDEKVISLGAQVRTREIYLYGVFRFRAMIPDPVSGGVAACFLYAYNSATEIDIFEVEGQHPGRLQFVTWVNPRPDKEPRWPDDRMASDLVLPDVHRNFKTYEARWTPDSVTYLVDGTPVATHHARVPRSPAWIMMNHWGTNRTAFGGKATEGERRFLIDWVEYVPYTPRR